jgi:hypothetical protein
MGMVDSADELAQYFWFCGLRQGVHSVNVPTKVRKEFLISNSQGKVTVNSGRVELVQWANLGGGVWKATIGETNVK